MKRIIIKYLDQEERQTSGKKETTVRITDIHGVVTHCSPEAFANMYSKYSWIDEFAPIPVIRQYSGTDPLYGKQSHLEIVFPDGKKHIVPQWSKNDLERILKEP